MAMIRSSAAELVSRGKRTGGGGDPEDLSLGTRLDDGDDDDGARPDKTLPWPARNKEGKRNKIAEAFHLGYFEDDSIATWVQRHMWIILLSAFGVMLMLLLTWRWHYMRGIRRMDIPRGSKFCQNNPRECIRNRFFKSVLYDYRRTRDTQLDPGRRQTAIKAGSTMRDNCRMPVKLLYVDPRIRQWWGHMLPGQERGLVQCPTPCVVVEDESSGEADVLVSMFRSEGRGRVRGQKTAVVNMEAHSIDYDAMAGADLFVSFHKEADVRVNYAYALKHGVACDKPAHDCLLSAVAESVRRAGPSAAAVERLPSDGSQSAVGVGNKASAGGRSRKGAVLFMSASCDRHGGFVRELVRLLRGDGGMGIDSFGKCFHDHSEAADPLFVKGRLGESKERISSQYKFHIVVENEIVEDYVTEKFFEGLKAGSLMVYLGAPNARDYAPGPNSFLDASLFAGADELAGYLDTVLHNKTLYDSYFSWRANGASLSFKRLSDLDLANEDKRSWQCRVCSAFVKRFCPI